jgi:hypothetical protein
MTSHAVTLSEAILPEVALALTSTSAALELVSECDRPGQLDCLNEKLRSIVPAYITATNPEIKRLYLGNEFCDRLIPNRIQYQQCINEIQQAGIHLSLVTPSVADKAMKKLTPAFESLQTGSEVIVNDWGVLRVIDKHYPDLVPVAGRQLCKMIKDPRLPSGQWAELYPSGIEGSQFQKLLLKFGIDRIELDVPPFVHPEFFENPNMKQSVYTRQGYATRGRICKIGCMHLDSAAKFAAGHGCQMECLKIVGTMTRTGNVSGSDLGTYQRGNTLFYKHSEEMENSITTAIERGWIDRLIIMGDWHEDHRAD